MPSMDPTLIDNAFKVLEKEGNKVARDGELPAGKNAEAGHDVTAFNAGMRYAMSRLKTSLKQISEGKYSLVEFPVQGQHKLPANGKAPAKKATAKKATKAPAKATKAPAKKAPAKKAVAKKTAAPVKRTVKKVAA